MALKKPFRGWTITGAGALANALQGGVIYWSMGLYIAAFEEEFAATRAKINIVESCLSVGVNVISPVVGILVDRWSIRNIVALGTVCMGLGLIVISQAGDLLSIFAAFALLIPLGVLALGVLPSSTAISRWFRKSRGLALGIALTGSSIGGAIVPPVMAFLIAAYGWRTAVLVAGIAVIAFAPVLRMIIVDRPEDVGLEQEEEGDAVGAALTVVDSNDWTFRQILATPQFWLMTLISATMLGTTLGLLANLGLHAKDVGLSLTQSGTLFSTIAALSFGGKIVMGRLFDRFGLRATGLLTAALLIAGLLGLAFATSYLAMLAACVVVGAGFGGVSPTWTNMIARGFGARSFGRAMGIMNPCHIPITAGSAPLAGYISDTTGSYFLVFMMYLAAVTVAAVALLFLRPPRYPGDTATRAAIA